MITAHDSSTNGQVNIQADSYANLKVLSQGGALQDAALAGRLFSVANQTAIATTAAFATTWTGLAIANPSSSGKNAIIHEFSYALTTNASSDSVIGLMTATINSDMADTIVIRNCLDGSSTASVCTADDDATIDTPILRRIVGKVGDGATNLTNEVGPLVVELKGGLVIPPGRCLLTYSTAVITTNPLFGFVWEEVPE